MRERPGIAGGAVWGLPYLRGRLGHPLFVCDYDDIADQLSASINPGFTVVRDVHGLVRAHEMRKSFFDREASDHPRDLVRFRAEEWPANALTVHALSENQD